MWLSVECVLLFLFRFLRRFYADVQPDAGQKKKKENGVTFTMKLMRKFIHAKPGFYIYFSVGIERRFCVGNSYRQGGPGVT